MLGEAAPDLMTGGGWGHAVLIVTPPAPHGNKSPTSWLAWSQPNQRQYERQHHHQVAHVAMGFVVPQLCTVIYSLRTALRLNHSCFPPQFIPFCFPPSGQPDSKDRFATGARNRRGSLCGREICRKVCVCMPVAMYVFGGFAFCFFRSGL